MTELNRIIVKYNISSTDIKKIIQYLVLQHLDNEVIDARIFNKIKEVEKHHSYCEIMKTPKSDIKFNNAIQQMALLYLEGLNGDR